MSKPKIAFICVHNSCRSQIAEAFGKVLAADVFESYSAGTETKPQINQDAVRLMKELYGIDMEKTQYLQFFNPGCRLCPRRSGQRHEPGGAAEYRAHRKNNNPPPQCRKEPV